MLFITRNVKKLTPFHRIGFRFCTRKAFDKCKPPWKVLFFGTDDFSVTSLKAICTEYKKRNTLQKLEVVTSFKNKSNPVRSFAQQENLPVHEWPLQISDGRFHIGLVVSFGYLIPASVIQAFPLGMINVHASLLPRWRGAAPIIYAIANGDGKTGITIMRIRPEKFDVGEIVLQKEADVADGETRVALSERLADLGAQALVECVMEMPDNLHRAKPQPELGVTYAPRINSTFASIDWENMSAKKIYDLERALTGLYLLSTKWGGDTSVKLLGVKLCNAPTSVTRTFGFPLTPGSLVYDKKDKLIKVLCVGGDWISVESVGVHKKRVMSATDFYNGYLSKQPGNKIFR